MSVSRFAGQATKNFRGINLPTITDFMPGKEDYGATASQGIAERGQTEATSLTEQARMMATGIGAQSTIKQAKYGADAARAAGSARGNAAMFGGLTSGIGSLGAGAIKGGHFGGGGGAGVTTYDHSDPVDIGGTSYPMMNEDDYNFDARWDY